MSDVQWLGTCLGIGYLVGLSIFGPAIFTAILNDLHKAGKIRRLIRDSLIALQFLFSIGSLVVVMGLVARVSKAQRSDPDLEWGMVLAFFLALGAVFASCAYLNYKSGKPWHGANER